MSNNRLTIWIEGREVLPVRAIPYVINSPRFQADILAQRFAGDVPFDEHHFPKRWTISAYFLIGEIWQKATIGEWEEVVRRVDDFKAILQGEFFTRELGYAVWRYCGAIALPAGWFVIYDDFLKSFRADLDGIIFIGRRPTEEELNFSPEIDAPIRAMILERFDEFTENKSGKPQASVNTTAIGPDFVAETSEKDLAALFDPVTIEALEKMFPSDGKWKGWAQRAKRNKLAEARVDRGEFNPYKAAIWFLKQGIKDWDWARCSRTLANNLPARSQDMKYLLHGNLG